MHYFFLLLTNLTLHARHFLPAFSQKGHRITILKGDQILAFHETILY